MRANVGTIHELCLAHHELEVVLFDLSGAYLLRKGVLRQMDIGVEPLGVYPCPVLVGSSHVAIAGMVQAWVGHFVTPQKRTYDKYD